MKMMGMHHMSECAFGQVGNSMALELRGPEVESWHMHVRRLIILENGQK